MPQPIMIGLIAAMGMLAAAILGLVGVLVGTRINWKLGKRTGDIQLRDIDVKQAGVGIQQQTVDIARNEKLYQENEGLRKENQEQYTANRLLRHEADQWDEERKTLGRDLQAAQDRVAFLEAALERSEAECHFALAAQATAEGGLKTAMKTISDFSPCP